MALTDSDPPHSTSLAAYVARWGILIVSIALGIWIAELPSCRREPEHPPLMPQDGSAGDGIQPRQAAEPTAPVAPSDDATPTSDGR